MPGAAWSAARGDEACEQPVDVWLVSTRHLPNTCRRPDHVDFRVEHREKNGCWHPEEIGSLVSDSTRPVVIFIHGNRYDTASARRQGTALARRIHRCQSHSEAVRTVVFSWPSESDGPPLRNARVNYARTRSDGHYLAALLSMLPPENDVGIVGYSFGATIALVGLEDVHDSDPAWRSERSGFLGLVLVTPAVRVDTVSPCGSARRAVESVDRLTILINTRDEALRFFPLLDRSGVDALGFVGLPRNWIPAGVEFSQVDASPIVGKEHSMQAFIDSPRLSCRITAGATNEGGATPTDAAEGLAP